MKRQLSILAILFLSRRSSRYDEMKINPNELLELDDQENQCE